MKPILAIALIVSLFVTGCATSTPAKRRTEKSAAYAALSPEWKALVDQGKLAVGMPMDGVYIAWGKPSQVVPGDSESGPTVTWIYMGTTWQEYRYWRYNRYGTHYGYGFPSEPYLDSDYVPLNYPAAQVVFGDGKVKSWNFLNKVP